MKLATSLAILGTASQGSILGDINMPHPLQYSDKTSYNHDTEMVKWYISGVRGLWYGFYRGFYHDQKKPESTCLSGNVDEQLQEIMQFLAYGELSEIF